MKRLLIVMVVLFAGLAVFGQKTAPRKDAPPAKNEAGRNLALEKKVFAKADDIKSVLQPEAKAKLDLIVKEVHDRLVSVPAGADYYALAQQEVNKKFARLSAKQSKLLCFYVLAEVARILAGSANSGEVSDLTEQRQLQLQQMMDERSQVENTLSNILKAFENTQNDLVANIK